MQPSHLLGLPALYSKVTPRLLSPCCSSAQGSFHPSYSPTATAHNLHRGWKGYSGGSKGDPYSVVTTPPAGYSELSPRSQLTPGPLQGYSVSPPRGWESFLQGCSRLHPPPGPAQQLQGGGLQTLYTKVALCSRLSQEFLGVYASFPLGLLPGPPEAAPLHWA